MATLKWPVGTELWVAHTNSSSKHLHIFRVFCFAIAYHKAIYFNRVCVLEKNESVSGHKLW